MSAARKARIQAPEDVSGFFAFLNVPPVPLFPTELHGKKMCAIIWCATAEPEVAEKATRPVRTVGKPALDHVGPLARVQLNRDRLSPMSRRVADEVGFADVCRNPFRAIIARGLEMIHAYEEALQILREYRAFKPPRIRRQLQLQPGFQQIEMPRPRQHLPQPGALASPAGAKQKKRMIRHGQHSRQPGKVHGRKKTALPQKSNANLW